MNKLSIEHLAPYLPYKLKGKVPYKGMIDNTILLAIFDSGDINYYSSLQNNHDYCDISEFTPILKPLSSLSKQELKDAGFDDHIDFLTNEKMNPMRAPYIMIRYLITQHYDVFGLINKGLAIQEENCVILWK